MGFFLAREKLEAGLGTSTAVPNLHQALAACAPASSAATEQNHQHRFCLRGTSRDCVQGPPRPGPPRYLLPRYPLAAALGPGFASPPSPTSARSTTPHTYATALRESGGERSPSLGVRNALGAAPHLWMQKRHAACLSIVLIRAVRHLGIKSLLPLHAGRKRFTLAGLG